MKEYRIEVTEGQDIRTVEADTVVLRDEWIVFYREPATGGQAVEYWRVAARCVVSIETKCAP